MADNKEPENVSETEVEEADEVQEELSEYDLRAAMDEADKVLEKLSENDLAMEVEKVDKALEELLENVDGKYEKLSAAEDELHQKSMQNLLAKAISQNSSDEDIDILLKFGADPNGCVEQGMRPIHYAAYVNNLDAVKILLSHDIDVNPRDFTGFTPLHICADKGHMTLLLYLIEHGAEVNVGPKYVEPEEKNVNEEVQTDNTENDNTNAAEAENEGVAEARDNEVVIEPEHNDGVAEARDNNVVGEVEAGDNVVVGEAGEGIAVAENVEGAVNEETGENLNPEEDPYKIPEDVMNDMSVEPLTLALENNNIEIVRILLANGADPNRRYFGGYEINLMPLQNVECLDILLSYGANPNVFNRRGLTPLMVAAKENEPRALRLLLSKGADIDQQRHSRFEQKSAVHLAIEAGFRGIVRTLCLQKAVLSKLPNYKYNALHTAVMADRVDLVELIMLFPIDIEEVTDDNCTALMLACASSELKNQKEIIYKLLQYGANPNCYSDIVNYSAPCLSPLAEYFGNESIPDFEIVIKLIQYGAKVHFSRRTSIVRQRDPFGMLPYLPVIMPHPEIWNLLVEACSYFDVNAMNVCMHFTKEQQQTYSALALTPLSLKHLVRISIRQVLQRPVIEKILKLPLPVFLLKYLVFLAV